jgi:hypothetical protein
LELSLHQYLHQSLLLSTACSLHTLVGGELHITYVCIFFGIASFHLCGTVVIELWCNLLTGSAGLGFLQFCNLNSFRTKFILGFSLFLGLSIPQYFNEYTSVAGFGPVHTRARWVRGSITILNFT